LRYLNILPRFLLTLPYLVRLSIAVLTVVFVLVLYIGLPQARNPSILAISISLVAWMFRRRGMLICLVVQFVVLWAFYSVRYRSVLLPSTSTMAFIAGTLAILVVGLLVSSQRDSLDLADSARQQAALAYAQQQELNRLKDQLMLNLGHELRTPLTIVHGYLELLLELNENLDSETQVNFLKNAMFGCEELQLLVNGLQDAGEVNQSKEASAPEEIEVDSLAHDVIRYFDLQRPQGEQGHRIQLDIPAQFIIWGQALYVRQILRNLLSNALKYSPVGTTIVISVESYGEEAPEVCISVQDAGPGIPPDEIPLLFGQFVRLGRDLSGPVRGTGLGLYISKQLVETMGGRIWVESTGVPGQGSRFRFTLPGVAYASIPSEAEDAFCCEVPRQSILPIGVDKTTV